MDEMLKQIVIWFYKDQRKVFKKWKKAIKRERADVKHL